MDSTFLRAHRSLLLASGCLFVVACVISTTTGKRKIELSELAATSVRVPIKAHLLDGSVILFADGATVSESMVTGPGRRFDALRRVLAPSDGVALDSVIGFEVYERRVNPFRTLVYSSAATALSVIGTAALLVVLFGSCPTIYGDSAGSQTLQAESFSYSIAPLLAKRDVDRMTIVPDAAGVIRLVVKNEALETHHLDHMEVIEVRHRPNEIVLPSPRGGALAVSELAASATVRDGAGRDVSRLVAQTDQSAFSTDDGLLDRAIAGGSTEDYLIITVPRRPGVDSVGLMLRARSSLLTTSVLYEHLMGRQGALALDWMADLSRITTLAKLASWYGGNFGMRVEVQDGTTWRPVIRLMDFGPTAWRTVGLAVPSTRSVNDSVRIRLVFAADAFRIDQLSIAHRVRRADQRLIPIARAIDSENKARADIVTMLSRADDREVETHPGDHFSIEFDAGREAGATRTFFFAGEGYYVEWLRPSWMKKGHAAQPFTPAQVPMREMLRSWKGGRDSLESLFFTRRVPVA